ncbi:hypothetical protein BDZ91DRAFT_653709 [Kalaharituber pfeilii]|nr:hypothetical protein BDZ91DRAFT_653709 [Kalaharituber pfeilii]
MSRQPSAIRISIGELAASCTKSKIAKLLRPRIILAIFIAVTIVTIYVFCLPRGTTALSNHPAPVFPRRTSSYAHRKHLIIVAGHAIWKGGPRLGEVDEEWALEPYQMGHNESLTWIDHIVTGVKTLASGNDRLLVFSGGETRQSSGPRSEAQSYWRLSLATTEIYAKDSIENLLFSICRFKEYVGNYPEFVTVIGYEFKRRRFSQLHRKAIRFPAENFRYIGIDPRNETLVKEISELEKNHGLLPFERDPYACFEEVLVKKRISRGWSQRGSGGYENSCPELKDLLKYCGLQKDGTVRLYDGPLPWAT